MLVLLFRSYTLFHTSRIVYIISCITYCKNKAINSSSHFALFLLHFTPNGKLKRYLIPEDSTFFTFGLLSYVNTMKYTRGPLQIEPSLSTRWQHKQAAVSFTRVIPQVAAQCRRSKTSNFVGVS